MHQPLNWALIGVGAFSARRGGANAIAYAHAEALKRNPESFRLIAAASLSRKNLNDFAGEYPCHTYLDLYELLEKEKPDGVTISTWALDREQHVLAAIHAGVSYVLIEKPLALSMSAARRIAKEAEQHGVRLFVNFQRRYGKPFRKARECCLSGEIGRIHSVDICQPEGTFLDFGPHFLNSALFFLNNPSPEFVQAAADFSANSRWHGIMTENRLSAVLSFADGSRWNIATSTGNDPERPAMRLNGSGGFLELYLEKTPQMPGVCRILTEHGTEILHSDENFHHGDTDKFLYFQRCYAEIAESLRSSKPCLIDWADGMKTQELLMGIYSAAISGKTVSFPQGFDDPVFRKAD